MGDEILDAHHLERPRVRRAEHHRRRAAGSVRLQPARRAHAPVIAGRQAREAPLRSRRGEVVAGDGAELEELGRHDRADRVAPDVLGPRRAAAVAVEAGHRIARAGQQLAADDVEVLVAGHARIVAAQRPRARRADAAMLPMATTTMPTATSAATRPSGALVFATSSAPAVSTTRTPAAMRQSSPTMKSHQKRPKPFTNRTTRPPAARAAPAA